MDKTKGAVRLCTTLETLGDSKRSIISFYNDIIDKLKGSTKNFHIYTFGGLKEVNEWLGENNYA